MLNLPQLHIVRNELQEVRIYQHLAQWLEREDANRPAGIHASDLLDPRLSYFQRISPKPLTERQVYFFTIGKILHSLLLQTGGASDSGPKEEFGIVYSPDTFTDDGCPVEVKTSRATREPTEKYRQADLEHYLIQLCIYQVLENRLEGELWILYINLKDETRRTFPEMRCYTVSMTEQQFYQFEQQVLEARDMLVQALEKRDPSSLPLCRAWRCGENTCTYWHNCKPPARYNRPRKEWAQ